MHNSDLLLKSHFLFGCSHYLFKCGLSTYCCVNSSSSWSDPHAQLILDDITPIDHATMVFTEATMATATCAAGLFGLMLKIRALKSDETHAFQQVFTHTPHMVFLTLKKKYNINFSGTPLSLWKQQETSTSPMSLSRAAPTTTLIII